MSGTVKTPLKFAATLSDDPAIREIQAYLMQANSGFLNNPILAASDWRWAQDGDVFALQFRTPPQDWNTVASFNSSGALSTDASGGAATGYLPLSTFTTAGDLPIGTGPSAATRLGSGPVGTFLGGNGVGVAPSYQSLSSGASVPWGPDLVAGLGPYWRAYVQWSISTTLTWEGIPRDVAGARLQEDAGGGTANAALLGSGSRLRVKRYTSGGAAGNLAGLDNNTGGANTWGYVNRSSLWTVVGTGSDITSQRIWVCFFSNWAGAGGTINGQTPPTSATANISRGYAFAYDSAVSANWLCVTGDGTNWSGTDSGVPVTASTAWAMSIDNTVYGTVTFKIQGWTDWASLPTPTVVNKTTNYPRDTGNVGIGECFLRNLAASARTFDICFYEWRGA